MAERWEIPHTWEEPEDLHLLLEVIRAQRPHSNARMIQYAYYIAEQAHAGQSRQSGEAYINHPLAVANIVTELRMDDDTICAAILHDVLEDCPTVSEELLRQDFGEDVLHLIQGVTKLKFKTPDGSTDRQRAIAETNRAAESLRKMLLAMAKDIRVMVIKLADRLHNMGTLDALPREKQIRIASETLDIYAPLAARLGIWQIKWQLEDLSFKFLHPKEYQEIYQMVAKSRKEREEELREATILLKERLQERGVTVEEVQGRPKHLYSIFNKIVKHGFKFEEILDLIALRVVVRDNADCYLALGVVNELWVPMMQHFSDYIARPKPNGYQSLHIKVIGPKGEPLEIQIRTRQMHDVAELGFAAHHTYKEGGKVDKDATFSVLRQQLFDWSTDYRTSSDFLRNLSTDLFSEQVFVFTPKGEVMDLPRDSTPVDFAFRVHSNLGLRLVGSKVNGKMVQLNHRLQNGDVVEVITRTNAHPSYDWMDFVKSPSAKSKLRQYFRTRDKSSLISRGKDALDRELRSLGLDPKDFLGDEPLKDIAPLLKDCETAQDVLAKVGEGLTSVKNVVAKLRGIQQKTSDKEPVQVVKSREGKPMLIADGVDNLGVKRAKCCDPLPGEEVVGYVTRGRGLMIHRKVCNNALAYLQNDAERLVGLNWPPDGSVYAVSLKIITINRQGLLMEIAVILGESKTNVSGMKIKTTLTNTAEIEATVEVQDINQLNLVVSRISNFSDVISVIRIQSKLSGTK